MNLTKQQMEHMAETMTPPQIKTWVQDEALKAWKDNFCRGTIEAATGVGKTRIAVLAIAEEFEKNPDATVVVGVPTETLRDDDWPKEFRYWGYGHLIEKVIFVCHTSHSKIKNEKEEIDLFVFDEIHNTTAFNSEIFQKYTIYKVLGLTATLPKGQYPTDMDKRFMIDMIAPSVYQVTLEEAVMLKLVSDFEVYVMKFDLDDKDYYVDGGTKKKPFKTTETRQYKYLTKMLQTATWQKKPQLKFVWIQKRMQFLYTLRQKELLAQDIMNHILKEKDGTEKRTLIFCGGINQANKLCGDWVYHSKVKDTMLTAFQELKIPYLGVCQALNEGKNIEELDQILVIQLNSKELDIIQRIGRTIRFREGHVARVIILIAKNTVDEQWYKEAFLNFDKKRIKEYYVKPTITPTEGADTKSA